MLSEEHLQPCADGHSDGRHGRPGDSQAIKSRPSGVASQQVPIITMTAYAMAGDRGKYLEAGMNEYIAKPVQMETPQQVPNRGARQRCVES